MTNGLHVGWETRSLKTASQDLQDRWEHLLSERFQEPGPQVLLLPPLTRYSLLVADATQFYEELSSPATARMTDGNQSSGSA